MKLEKLFTELEEAFPFLSHSKETVSKVNVGWQIEHALKVIIGICKTLKASEPTQYKWKLNPRRSILLTIGTFPRGVAKAPRSTRPVSPSNQKDLQNILERAKEEVTTIVHLPKNSYFEHPIFGHLNLKQSQRFLVLHTLHHIKIIRDILK